MYCNRLFKVLSGIILITTCISMSQVRNVYAGEINSEESRLLGYVNQTFEQDGLSYKVNAAYISKLKSKLMEEDIDLTASDVDIIIGEINNNVATGVENGYLVLIKTPTEIPSVTEYPTKEDSTDAVKAPTIDANGIDGGNEKAEKNTNEGTNQESNGKEEVVNNQGNTFTNPIQNEASDKDGKEEVKQKPEDYTNEVTTPLKNTGYSLKTIPYIVIGLGVLMLVGVLSLYLLNYVEVPDESKK